MRLRMYIMMVTGIALLAIGTVHEALRQTQARYAIGRLLGQEQALAGELASIKASVAELRAAPRLQELVKELSEVNRVASDGLMGNSQRAFEPLSPVLDTEVEDQLVLE